MAHTTAPLLGIALALLSSCGAPQDGPECGGEVHLSVTSSVPDPVSSDLVIRGTAAPSRNVAIRSLSAGGIPADADSFNYGNWSVTLPFSALQAGLPLAVDSNDVVVPILATAVCGSPGETSITVHVNRHPEIQVKSLTVTASLPAGRTFLPADGSASAVLVVSANPEARGASVTLDANGLARFEGSGDSASLVLAGDGTSPASASVLVTATGGGTIFVTAASGGVVAKPISLITASAPRLVPAQATLRPGQSISVALLKDISAQAVSCDVSAGAGLSVIKQQDGYVVAADEPLAAAVKGSITCRDGYGQTSTAIYDAEP